MEPLNTFQVLKKTVVIQLGMCGLRVDKWNSIEVGDMDLIVVNALVFLAMLVVGYVLPADMLAILITFCVGWTLYYVGNSLILGTRIKEVWRNKRGQRRSLLEYEVLLAFLFQLQGTIVFQSTKLKLFPSIDKDPLEYLPYTMTLTMGLFIFLTGWVVKTMATYTAGLHTYYYNDMFTDTHSILYQDVDNTACCLGSLRSDFHLQLVRRSPHNAR